MRGDDDRLEELGRLWRTGGPGDEPPSGEEVLMQVKRSARRFGRSLLWRDVREVTAGLLAVAVMGYMTWRTPGWFSVAGASLGALSVALVLLRLLSWRSHDRAVRGDLPLAERLQAEIERVERQAAMLTSVGSWYVLPLALGGMAWVTGIALSSGLPPGRTAAVVAVALACSAALFAAVGWVTVRLNRFAVRRQLDPYRDELRRLLETLQAG